MHASDLMTKAVQSCGVHDNLEHAAQIMWEHDCGVVPVVDADNRVVGMITDRDVAMAAYTQGRPLRQIPVSSAMAKEAYGVRVSDRLETVEALMRRARVRRVPVLDEAGRLLGIISLNDLTRHVHRAGLNWRADGLSSDSIAQTLSIICEPRATHRAKDSGTAPPANAGQLTA